MRRALTVATLATALLGVSAGTALAAPPVPDPRNCHEVNKALGIDNVRDCSGDPVS